MVKKNSHKKKKQKNRSARILLALALMATAGLGLLAMLPPKKRFTPAVPAMSRLPKPKELRASVTQSVKVCGPLYLMPGFLPGVAAPCTTATWPILDYIDGYPNCTMPSMLYQLEVALDQGFYQKVYTSAWQSERSITLDYVLRPETTYFYRLKAADPQNVSLESLWSIPKSCTTPLNLEKPAPIGSTRHSGGREEISDLIATPTNNAAPVEVDPETPLLHDASELPADWQKKIRDSVRTICLVAMKQDRTFFADVRYHWGRDCVENAKKQNIVDGYPDGTFRPDDPINRAEITKISINLFHPGQIVKNSKISFPDLESGAWYVDYIATAIEKKVLSGYPDGLFRPAQKTTRAETLKILLNASDVYERLLPSLKKTTPDFKDISADDWFAPYVALANQYDIVEGYKDKTFRPHRFVTRAEAIKMALGVQRLRQEYVSLLQRVQAKKNAAGKG